MAKTGPWEWRGNQLFAPERGVTLLRDVTFWNATEQDRQIIVNGPEMFEALDMLMKAYGAHDGRNGNSSECWDKARAVYAKIRAVQPQSLKRLDVPPPPLPTPVRNPGTNFT